ncbi:MAG: RNA polymerase factor sigma-54 [Candidatus Omnitrophota bacterium]
MPLKIEQTNKLTYKLKFTPQMKLSTKLLQLPFIKLQEFIQQQLEENPLLLSDNAASLPEQFKSLNVYSAGESYKEKNYASGEQEKRDFKKSLLTKPLTLNEHLLRQLHLFTTSDLDCKIGELIIGNINDNGYLTCLLEDIAKSADTDISHAEKLLSLIQTFDPAGVGAKDLRECLLLQLKARVGGKFLPAGRQALAGRIIDKFLPFLEKKRYKYVASKLKVSVEDVKQALKEITALEPKPGRSFNTETAMHLIPDAQIIKNRQDYEVLFNSELPDISLNIKYKQMLIQKNTPQDVKQYLTERLQAAKFLIDAIAQRKETLQKVIEDIVYIQKDFLDNGPDKFKPMTLEQIAKRIGKHKSTVSRAINNKYIQTPWGILELRYFLNSGIKQKDGESFSSKAIKSKIKELIEGEDKKNPLMDQQIAVLLKQEKISIAPRTTTKYRNQLKIPSSKVRRE